MTQEALNRDLAQLDDLESHLFAHRYALEVIGTNGDTIDPPAAAPGRAEAMALLDEDFNELLCSKETGELLERLSSYELPEERAAQVRVLKRDRDLQVNVPPEEQATLTKLQVEANHVWHTAKLENDWDSFEPYLDKLVEITRRVAGFRNPTQDPYDTLLQHYEPGTSRNTYDEFFGIVKEAVVPLVADIVKTGWQPSTACIDGVFDKAAQEKLQLDLVKLIQVNTDALHIAETEHPFEDSPTSSQSVIGGHIYEDNLISNLYSMLHEGGHALYDQGVNPAYDYTSMQAGTSSGMHESQSRFMENIVGRSEAFAPVLLELLEKHFPDRFADVSPYDFYLAVNRAEPSLIRIEADELTYPLHIIVRYEIERLLIAGEASAKDVPGLWADKMHEYLGVEVPDHTRGALQDTHWSDGSFGYFPSYALGSAYGAQFKDAMVAQGMDFDAVLASGNLTPITSWLKEKIWIYGGSKDSPELIEGACSTSFDATHYANYLVEKFSGIYGLDK